MDLKTGKGRGLWGRNGRRNRLGLFTGKEFALGWNLT